MIGVISGVLGGYSGSVRVGGREVKELSAGELAAMVAVVPQETETALPFTVTEVALMGRHPYLKGIAFETEADMEIVSAALERAGAAHLAGRNIQKLSSGERQRVIFARALAQQPGALLLDEPTSFLDIRYQVELYDLVRGLVQEESVGVLTALHDLNLAAEYCDRVYLLTDGEVYASGPTDDVLTYANLTEVFGSDVYVDTNDITGKLLVIPLSGRARREIEKRKGKPAR
jgi:iron complex transport system ATP-binding protein